MVQTGGDVYLQGKFRISEMKRGTSLLIPQTLKKIAKKFCEQIQPHKLNILGEINQETHLRNRYWK